MPTKQFYLPIYTAGQTVDYNNNQHTVEMVYIAGEDILLKLSEISELVNSTKVVGVESTRFKL